jgi:hypothetical protein
VIKRILLITAFLTLVFLTASRISPRLVRLTVVNKSGLALEIRLTGTCDENSYYLRVPEGDRFLPMVKEFTIIPDTYQVQPYYVQIWDPVYGYDCNDPGAKRIDMMHNTRILIDECTRTLPNSGEAPSMVKFGGAGGRGRRGR